MTEQENPAQTKKSTIPGINVTQYPYHYNVVQSFATGPGLSGSDLVQSEGAVSGKLADLFTRNSIEEISFTPLHEAIKVANRWLMHGDVDQKEIDKVIRHSLEQIEMLRPVLEEVLDEEQKDRVFFGSSIGVAGFGNAIQLVQNTLRFANDETLNTPENRDKMRQSVEDYQKSLRDRIAAAPANIRTQPAPFA